MKTFDVYVLRKKVTNWSQLLANNFLEKQTHLHKHVGKLCFEVLEQLTLPLVIDIFQKMQKIDL